MALIISNSNYANPGDSLPGAVRDANLMRDALTSPRLGFQMLEKANASKLQIEQAVDEFAKRLQAAGPDVVGIIYYVGHGSADQDGKENYILPVDVPNVKSADVAKDGIGLRALLRRLKFVQRARAIVVIIDACRTAASGSGSPLAETFLAPADEQSPGFLTALSTSRGYPASDNGPYARLLSHKLQSEGLSLDQVFAEVRLEVAKATQQRQLPTEQSKLLEPVCLLGCSAGAFGQSAALLEGTRLAAERAIARLAGMHAESSCKRAWDEIARLSESAKLALASGRMEVAGQTYTLIVTSADQAFQYLYTTEMYKRGQQARDAATARSNQQRLARLRDQYQRRSADLEKLRNRLGAPDSNDKPLVDELNHLVADAERSAQEESYEDAIDKLVDAENKIYELKSLPAWITPKIVQRPKRAAGPAVSSGMPDTLALELSRVGRPCD
ncbi:MAG TPA: caspase family protein [Albitalea sp.]